MEVSAHHGATAIYELLDGSKPRLLRGDGEVDQVGGSHTGLVDDLLTAMHVTHRLDRGGFAVEVGLPIELFFGIDNDQ